MTDVESIKNNIKDVCSQHSEAINILKKANGKLTYVELAAVTKISSTLCSTILNKACSLNLVDRVKPGLFKRKKIISGALIDSSLKKSKEIVSTAEQKIRIKKKKKVINTTRIKSELREYLQNNYYFIHHPFSDKKEKISKEKISKAFEVLIKNLEADLGLIQLEGLELRFYNSFSDFLSCSSLNKSESIAAFSNLIKCFEPYLKKVAALKNRDNALALRSLDEELIKKAISFTSNIKKRDEEYWKDKSIHEACIRFVYPYRHMEAHEARDYSFFQIQKIIYYFFSSIIYLNIN